ncbi:hypothetical protein [Dinoroseobacter sp. S124A]|uniref:hypothetical protein n=1 Tax=Dinoroseobacter sp. S124A TaxID=3415128 RepID=UPI003C79BFD5
MNRRDALTDVFMTGIHRPTDETSNFRQAVEGVARDVLTIKKNARASASARVLSRLAEPDRVLSFRVTWEGDTGGTLYAPDGLSAEAVGWVQARKAAGENMASPPPGFGASYLEGASPWEI